MKRSTSRVRGENVDSTTLCTPVEKTGMSSNPWQRRKYPSTRVKEKKTKSPKRGGEGQMTGTRPVVKTEILKKRQIHPAWVLALPGKWPNRKVVL